jgi:hypothetical protein
VHEFNTDQRTLCGTKVIFGKYLTVLK